MYGLIVSGKRVGTASYVADELFFVFFGPDVEIYRETFVSLITR